MGPQLVRCGMQILDYPGLRTGYPLQWGRNLFVAECSHADEYEYAELVLQWGRNLFVAECRRGHAQLVEVVLASMGPQLVRCGMEIPDDRGARLRVASMGPQLVRCGMITSSLAHRLACGQLQWGRNLFVAEWRDGHDGSMPRMRLQWGRNLFVAECRPVP